MSAGEFFLTLLVALVAFGPNQLPMLAQHLGQWVAKGRRYKQLAVATWQSQLNALQLQENRNKAEEAEASYSLDNADSSSSH